MSIIKKQISLIAESVEFKVFSIVYHVVSMEEMILGPNIVLCADDICDKDLILKPTVISENSMKVVFTPSNVTSEFYQRVFEESIKGYDEYRTNKKDIYDVGDVVGYVIL